MTQEDKVISETCITKIRYYSPLLQRAANIDR